MAQQVSLVPCTNDGVNPRELTEAHTMAVPNAFLLNIVSVNGNHLPQCFCVRCRAVKLTEIESEGFGREAMFTKAFHELELTDEQP